MVSWTPRRAVTCNGFKVKHIVVFKQTIVTHLVAWQLFADALFSSMEIRYLVASYNQLFGSFMTPPVERLALTGVENGQTCPLIQHESAFA